MVGSVPLPCCTWRAGVIDCLLREEDCGKIMQIIGIEVGISIKVDKVAASWSINPEVR
jgi:hypothetical protein